jgi:hypothetical protein
VGKKDTVVVYWGVHTPLENQTYMSILWDPPVPLINTLPKGFNSSTGNYKKCPALIDLTNNVFTMIQPFTSTISFRGGYETPEFISDQDVWSYRASPLENCYATNLEFSWSFFSEESIDIKVTPAYLHNTSASKTGFIASGIFNISKWFRPIRITYVLWEGNDTLTVTKGDPVFYLEFLTDKRITFKHFDCTEELMSISSQVANSNDFMRFKGLTYRYKRFMESNRNKLVLKLIKDNLLE